MSNFVFYDFETSSSNKQFGQILEIGAILADDNLNEFDRFGQGADYHLELFLRQCH